MANETMYDRQIRLFGHKTQELIQKTSVLVLQASKDTLAFPCLVSGEILKNLVLLGVNEIHANNEALMSYNMLVPHDMSAINASLKFEVAEAIDDIKRYDLIILIDVGSELKNVRTVYVCSRCLSYDMKTCKHLCKKRDVVCLEAEECLLGSIIVQEFIKMLQNCNFAERHELCIF